MMQHIQSSNKKPEAKRGKTQKAWERRILVVDDDADNRVLSSLVLRLSHYKVDTAENGATGREALLATKYDLLITDNQMPRLSGVELIQQVRRTNLTMPIILASGTLPTDTDDLQLAAVLEKPFTPDELLKAVEAALK